MKILNIFVIFAIFETLLGIHIANFFYYKVSSLQSQVTSLETEIVDLKQQIIYKDNALLNSIKTKF